MPLPEVLVDLDRTTGGMLTLPPRQGSDRGGWHAGTADTLWRNAELIRERGAELFVVLSADAVHKLDYREVVEAHLQGGQQLTMVTTQVAAAVLDRLEALARGAGDDGLDDLAIVPM